MVVGWSNLRARDRIQGNVNIEGSCHYARKSDNCRYVSEFFPRIDERDADACRL